jgi:hypothetical protein
MTEVFGEKSRRNGDRAVMSLTEQLLRRLNGYGMAAGAAGVAVLACSASADAAPICGNLSVNFARAGTYAFNPAQEKVAPFNVAETFNELSSHTQSRQSRGFFTPNTPDAKEMVATNGWPADVAAGATVGPGGKFGKGKSYGLLFGSYYRNRVAGNFRLGQTGYVGFLFSQLGQTHYGWLRLKVENYQGRNIPVLLLSAFGYESAANTAIPAGGCGASASSVESGSPAVAPTKRQSPSLGLLALGSEGLSNWRYEK